MINLPEELQLDCQQEKLQFFMQASEELIKKQMQEDMSILQKPTLNFDLGLFVIINNIPTITSDKEAKLKLVLTQILNKLQLQNEFTEIKVNHTGQGLITFISDEAASKGAVILNGFQMTSVNIFQAYTVKDFNAILQTQTLYTPLILKPKQQLQNWLLDPHNRNQILYLQDKTKLTIEWFSSLQGTLEPIVQEIQVPPTEKIEWSRNGTYLVLYTDNQFLLYGGYKNEFSQLHAFNHPSVINVVFSNNEELALSYNGTKIQTDSTENFILWKVREELKLRTFQAGQLDILSTFQFSNDGQILARISQDYLSFYKHPSYFQNERPLTAINIQNYIWVEKTDLICYAQYTGSFRENDKESKQNTQIMFFDVNSKKEYRWRKINFECDRIDLFSNTNGKWVIATMKKKIKKKVVSTMLQVTNLKKLSPDGLELVSTEILQEEYDKVFVEPRTGKVAFCFKDKSARAVQAYNYQFFVIDEQSKSIDLKSAGGMQLQKDTNEVLWSNTGTYFAYINNIKGSPDQGKIEFAMVTKKVSQDQTVQYNIEVTKSSNHFYMSHASWDPSGTTFVTMSDQWGSVIVWSAIGEQLYRNQINKIQNILWRNKPINILNEKTELSLTQPNIQKEYFKKYEEEDDKIINKNKFEREAKRQAMKDQFQKLMDQKKKLWIDARDTRKRMLGFDADDRSKLVSIEIIEREEVVNNDQV